MTRILSDILSTDQAPLRLQLAQLERLSGHRNADISLSVEVVQAAKQKIHALGLDKHDTTAPELYQALLQRVSDDDKRLERSMQTRAATYISAEAHVMDGLVHALQTEIGQTSVMTLKPACAKRLLRHNPPKRLLKSLKYRSLDAMLRQEAPTLLVGVAQHIETLAWRKAWLDGYKKLSAVDFEEHNLQILHPSSARWQQVARQLTTQKAHTVITTPELGAIVLLPLPEQRPAGMLVATTALAIQAANNVQAAANYIKAAQVQADFGERVAAIARGDIQIVTSHLPQAASWQLLHRYFATTKARINDEIFGPYVRAIDFGWHNTEAVLAKICPAMAFWQSTAHLSFLERGQAVSFNIVDVATSCCNRLAYEARSSFHAQQALWHELCLRYLDHDSVEQAITRLFQSKRTLATVTAT